MHAYPKEKALDKTPLLRRSKSLESFVKGVVWRIFRFMIIFLSRIVIK
jgi:hypothetical protein